MCGHEPIAAVLLDAPNTEVRNGHCEGFSNCVLMGANVGSAGGASGQRVSNIVGPPSGNAGTYVVQVSPNYTKNSDYVVSNLHEQSGGDTTGNFFDGVNGITVSDNYLGFYSTSTKNGLTNIITTDTANPNRFEGVATGAPSGAPSNTDFAGICTLGSNCGGGTDVYNFKGTYHNAPICTCMDNVGGAPLHLCKAAATNAMLTFSGTTPDPINYICIVTN